MKKLIYPLIFLLFALTQTLFAEDGYLLVSKDLTKTEFSKKEITEIFLGKKTNWDDGRRINIGYSVEEESVLEVFVRQNVGKNYRRFKKYWIKKVFAGYGVAPKLFKSSEDAMDFVSRNEGVIVFTNLSQSKIDFDKFRVATIQ